MPVGPLFFVPEAQHEHDVLPNAESTEAYPGSHFLRILSL
jgi:hypothetical protein